MLIITEIKVMKTDRDIAYLQRMTEPMCRDVNPTSYEESVITREMIEGRRFVHPATGTDMVIGWSKDVQAVLQLPFEAFGNMERRMSDMTYESIQDHKEIRKYRLMMVEGQAIIKEFEDMSVLGFIKYKVYKWYNKLTSD